VAIKTQIEPKNETLCFLRRLLASVEYVQFIYAPMLRFGKDVYTLSVANAFDRGSVL